MVGSDREALRFGRDATRMNPRDPGHWYTLGIALQRTGDDAAALAAYRRAAELAPGEKRFRKTSEEMEAYLGTRGGASRGP